MAHRKQIRQTHLLRGRDGGWQAAFWSCGTGRGPIYDIQTHIVKFKDSKIQ